MTFNPDLKLREAVFSKLWMRRPLAPEFLWEDSNGNFYKASELPPIETSWEVCAEYLVPFLHGQYRYYIDWSLKTKSYWFSWQSTENASVEYESEIQNNNIALAACQAFRMV